MYIALKPPLFFYSYVLSSSLFSRRRCSSIAVFRFSAVALWTSHSETDLQHHTKSTEGVCVCVCVKK